MKREDIKVGMVVRRTTRDHRNFKIGDLGEVIKIHHDGYNVHLRHVDTGIADTGGSHDPANLEEVKPLLTVSKDDSNKPNPGLMQLELAGALNAVAKVISEGDKKHPNGVWRNVPKDVYQRSFFRHLTELNMGGWAAENTNPDFGLPHIDHLIANLLFYRQKMLMEKSNAA